MSKLVKKQSHLLHNGDVVYFVYRKSEPEQSESDFLRLESTFWNSYAPLKQWLVFCTFVEGLLCDVTVATVFSAGDPMRVRGSVVYSPVDVDPAPVVPVTLTSPSQEGQSQPGYEESQPSTSSCRPHLYATSSKPRPAAVSGYVDVKTETSAELKVPEGPLTLTQTLQAWGERQTEEGVEPDRKRLKTSDPAGQSVFASSVEEPAVGVAMPAAPPTTVKDSGEAAKMDKMEESLTCIICQDLLHDCVSLQPCMHTFCAACYSGWMERSSLCPTCRCPVERIRKNHILNNLVEAYLLQHPEKCRSEDDVRSMDARNKISRDMMQPRVERSYSDEEGSSDYLLELSDNDSDASDMSQPYMTCRQCPGYCKDVISPAWLCGSTQEEVSVKAPRDGPSTSSDTCTAPQEYRCPPQGSHLICTCCLQPMPDRRAEHIGSQSSPQHCMVCQRPFCHLYWGCQRIGCQGCLARFSDLNLTAKCLDGVLNNNNYESEILQNYLTSRGVTWKEMLQEALAATQQGLYHLSDYRVSADSLLCYCCGLRSFKELAYKYRENIPANELPACVTSRPDCYWGRNCRTQVKVHHAMKFNHICEQTRFKN
ncbi:hypothetical protein P4O66_012069 [Electrophorus voltai]|uniref:RING-type domain-containing protein n=1 Tax=Electrophorus voltai TaxID=2609070 RepID=A0AAD8Z3B8_9TELE|nr:hypothetical protein P4O66_012069 [Electrophorus voltai]